MTEKYASDIEKSPMGHLLGVHVLYMKDFTELSRTEDALKCEAKVILNISPEDGVEYLIKAFNQDGHSLMVIQPKGYHNY
jgi:hypothetical protein